MRLDAALKERLLRAMRKDRRSLTNFVTVALEDKIRRVEAEG